MEQDTSRPAPTGTRVLVTGATGFIGSRLVRRLLARGDTVRVLVRDLSRARELGAVQLHEGDLLDPESLEGAGRDVDRVIHCASMLGKWGTDESLIRDVNVTGTVNLVRAVAAAGARGLLHLSAGGVTGPVASRAVDESYEPHPATAYERTKLEGERQALAVAAELGLAATVVRPTFTYGPGDPHKLALFRAIRRGRYAFIGDGESVNHPVFIEDLLNGIELALERGRAGETYIIGGERPITKRELVHTIADALGARRPRLCIPRWFAAAGASVFEILGRSIGFEPILTHSRVMMMADNFGYSIKKATDELGYTPQTDLRTGIAATVESYRLAGVL